MCATAASPGAPPILSPHRRRAAEPRHHGSIALTGGGGGTVVGSAAAVLLLGWGAWGDEDGEWPLLVHTRLANRMCNNDNNLNNKTCSCGSRRSPRRPRCSKDPLPFWYDGVAVTAGIVGGTSHVRRAVAVSAGLATGVTKTRGWMARILASKNGESFL
jgi:hypothetical protein